jgi:hypothetical protein
MPDHKSTILSRTRMCYVNYETTWIRIGTEFIRYRLQPRQFTTAGTPGALVLVSPTAFLLLCSSWSFLELLLL